MSELQTQVPLQSCYFHSYKIRNRVRVQLPAEDLWQSDIRAEADDVPQFTQNLESSELSHPQNAHFFINVPPSSSDIKDF